MSVSLREVHQGEVKSRFNEMYLRILVVNKSDHEVLEVHSLGRQAKYIHNFKPAKFPEVDNDVVRGRFNMTRWITTWEEKDKEKKETTSDESEISDDKSDETLRQSVIHAGRRSDDAYIYDDERYMEAMGECNEFLKKDELGART